MRLRMGWVLAWMLAAVGALAQGTVPTFQYAAGTRSYLMAGRAPGEGARTTIPVVLVAVRLEFEGRPGAAMDAKGDVAAVLASPVFASVDFAGGGRTQFGDAMLRATFAAPSGWHTMLGRPEVRTVTVKVPVGNGYLLHSARDGGRLAVVDADYVQGRVFEALGRQDGRLVVALTHNTTFYVDGDATICCTWGTHGVDGKTGTSFVMASYLRGAPGIVRDKDVQPLTQQLGQFLKDPLHDPQRYGYNVTAPGNDAPAWMWPGGERGCGGTGLASSYFLLEPTDTNLKNDIPASKAFVLSAKGVRYHLENTALLGWYLGGGSGLESAASFPDAAALPAAAVACAAPAPAPAAIATAAPGPVAGPYTKPASGHRLIGYWTGDGGAGRIFPLREVSAQWDIVIVAFAGPAKDAPEGTLSFRAPRKIDAGEFKADVARLKAQGRKVLLSLGGGGVFFHFDDPAGVERFVSSVGAIVEEYGFDGVDIDFETPSLVLEPGDRDFRHPTTPSIVHLIAALRQLHDRFGPGFMLSLVPEGPQLPGGHAVYGGQFGSYLPIAHALRDILSFVDVQDYNTPPMEGLDGEIVQSHTVDYHAALTEMLLRGFDVGGDAAQFFPPLPASKVAVGFLTDYDRPETVTAAMDALILGKSSPGRMYRLRGRDGYAELLGAMFWTIDDDRLRGYAFSDTVGPELHGYGVGVR